MSFSIVSRRRGAIPYIFKVRRAETAKLFYNFGLPQKLKLLDVKAVLKNAALHQPASCFQGLWGSGLVLLRVGRRKEVVEASKPGVLVAGPRIVRQGLLDIIRTKPKHHDSGSLFQHEGQTGREASSAPKS